MVDRVINKFITDKTKIYLVYKVDGREREIHCTIYEHLQKI